MVEPGEFNAYQQAVRTTSRLLLGGLLAPLAFATQASSPGQFLGIVAVAAALIGSASGIGGVLGFLFGIPRSLQDLSSTAPPSDGPLTAPNRASIARYAGNTSLEQISDWLTKILVGVGLTQLTTVPSALGALSDFLAPALGGFTSSGTFGVLLALYFAIGGLFLAYMWTRLYMALLLAESDSAANRLSTLADTIASNQQTERRVVSNAVAFAAARIVSTLVGGGREQPSDADVEKLKSEAISTATDELERQQVVVDISQVKPASREPIRIAVDETTTVAELLNLTYLAISDVVGAYTYGSSWILQDAATGQRYTEIGTEFARRNLKLRYDERRLAEAGIRAGSRVVAIPLSPSDRL